MAWKEFAPFTSSNVSSIRYDAEQAILEVTFNSGGTYQYYNVPSQVADDFERADSKGSFLATNIKGSYQYSRV